MPIRYNEDKFEKLKKRVEKLEESFKKLQSENIQEALDKDVMEEKERIVFEFIKENDGTNIENIIRNLPSISRKTIYKKLHSLEDKGYILSQQNLKNRQTRSIFVNNDNMVLKVEEEITEFKDKLFVVLDKLEIYVSEGTLNTSDHLYDKIIEYLRENYFKFISIYFFRALLQWHQYIADKQIIYQLYTLLIMNIMQIQERISKFVLGFVPAIPFYKEICTDDDDIPHQIEVFSHIGLNDEYRLLSNSLNKINYTYSEGKKNFS